MTLTPEERSMLRLIYLCAFPQGSFLMKDMLDRHSPAGTPYKRILNDLWGKGVISMRNGVAKFDRDTVIKVLNAGA